MPPMVVGERGKALPLEHMLCGARSGRAAGWQALLLKDGRLIRAKPPRQATLVLAPSPTHGR